MFGLLLTGLVLTSLLLTVEFANRFAALLTTKTSEVSPLQSKTVEENSDSLSKHHEKLTEFRRQSKARLRLNCCRLDFSKTRRNLECNLIQINKMD